MKCFLFFILPMESRGADSSKYEHHSRQFSNVAQVAALITKQSLGQLCFAHRAHLGQEYLLSQELVKE